MNKYIRFFDQVDWIDRAQFGGKGAYLGFLAQCGKDVEVPTGFVITLDAYRQCIMSAGLYDQLATLHKNFTLLYTQKTTGYLQACGEIADLMQALIEAAPIDEDVAEALRSAYQSLESRLRKHVSVAVRSSALLEDMCDASCAGQHASVLGCRGYEAVFAAYKNVLASLFSLRALVYYHERGSSFDDFGMACCVQQMVGQVADDVISGVSFTLHPETNNRDCVYISAVHGFGDALVGGEQTPDSWHINKYLWRTGFCGIADSFVHQKQRYSQDFVHRCVAQALAIEDVYARTFEKSEAVDIEWVYEKSTDRLYCVQVRPAQAWSSTKGVINSVRVYKKSKENKVYEKIVTGHAIGQSIVSGRLVKVTTLSELIARQNDLAGAIVCAPLTNPDWTPYLGCIAGLITVHGGRTCHAAIVARERSLPAVVGILDDTLLTNGEIITLDCSTGERGVIWRGKLAIFVEEYQVACNETDTRQLMLIMSDPDKAWAAATLPVSGVGLVRMEFIASHIGVHPSCVYHPEKLSEEDVNTLEDRVTVGGYSSVREMYIQQLKDGLRSIAGAFYPRPVIIRLGDFKSNEYRLLLGGASFEAFEENPMLGLRGAARYVHQQFTGACALEAQALKDLIVQEGLSNIRVMVPFVRTVDEARAVAMLLDSYGLTRDLAERYMMVEIPSNVILLEEFAHYFDGFSIGSNDLTQLTLGVDRDSGVLSGYDERNDAVKWLIQTAIQKAQKLSKPIGICGQAPTDFPEYGEWLIQQGISTISMQQDAIWPFLARVQKQQEPELMGSCTHVAGQEKRA